MKLNYEAPTAKFVGFAPAEKIAASWDWSAKFNDENSTEETTSSFDVTLPGKNPEGDF